MKGVKHVCSLGAFVLEQQMERRMAHKGLTQAEALRVAGEQQQLESTSDINWLDTGHHDFLEQV